MDGIKELNLKYINYLSDKFGIENRNGKASFKSNKKGVSNQDIYDTLKFIIVEIWNQKNIHRLFNTFSTTNEKLFYYWPSSETIPIDSYLGKVGILDYKTIISDPISFICKINPNYEDAPNKKPYLYFEYVIENSLFLVSLSEWIEKGFLYIVPDLFYWDQVAYMQLGDINRQIRNVNNLQQTKEWETFSLLFKFEQGSRLLIDKQKYFYGNIEQEEIKKYFPDLSDSKVEKIAKDLKNTPKHKREIQIIKMFAEEKNIPDQIFKNRLKKWKKHYIYDVKNYFGEEISKESVKITKGLTLSSSLYVSNKFNAIPVTDDDVNRAAVQLFSKGIKLDDIKMKELEYAQSKISIEAPFFKNISPEFIEKYKSSEYPNKLNSYFENKWDMIRNLDNRKDFDKAIVEFNDLLRIEIADVRNDYLKAKTDARFTGYKEFIDKMYIGSIEQEFWSVAVKSIAAIVRGLIAWRDDYDTRKYELKKNPLFIFLDKD